MSVNFDISIPFHYFSLPSKPLLGISNCLLDLYRDLMKEKGIPDLTPDYYLRAMEMYRYTYAQYVEEENKKKLESSHDVMYSRSHYKHPVFLYVSDDIEWGKVNLLPRTRTTRDLYFVGEGLPSATYR